MRGKAILCFQTDTYGKHVRQLDESKALTEKLKPQFVSMIVMAWILPSSRMKKHKLTQEVKK